MLRTLRLPKLWITLKTLNGDDAAIGGELCPGIQKIAKCVDISPRMKISALGEYFGNCVTSDFLGWLCFSVTRASTIAYSFYPVFLIYLLNITIMKFCAALWWRLTFKRCINWGKEFLIASGSWYTMSSSWARETLQITPLLNSWWFY